VRSPSPQAPFRPPSRLPSPRRLPFLALALALSGCVAHRPLPPPAPMPREQAVDRALDFAQHNGYGRVSLRGAQLEGDVWQVLLRVKDPFKGRLLVSVHAFGGQVLSADAWHKGGGDRRDEQGEQQNDNESDAENGNGRHREHKRKHQRSDEED